MKPKLLLVLGAFGTALALFAFTRIQFTKTQKKKIVSCRPSWEEIDKLLEEAEIPPIPGAGAYTWKISTQHDSAQYYFNQGINMYYAFHIIESMASFKKAAKFDPSSAMLQWAQALAYGPNINDLGYAASPEAITTSRKAEKLSGGSSAKEKMLIRAQVVRYSTDSSQSREKLNQLYVDEMKKVYEAYPNDADVAALYADALMLQHPWDLWRGDGQPQPWTPAIREVLEKLLAHTPHHPGANHYYIHVMEASPFYKLALPSADRLGALTPALSHTVHMPSHIYLRAGQYDKGTSVNESAVSSYRSMINLYAPVTANDFIYIIHNLHMQTNNSLLAGRKAYSRKSAEDTRASIPVDYLSIEGGLANIIQYIYHTPILVDVKFGEWDALLNIEKPHAKQVYSNVFYHFGKGMAYAGKSNFLEAKIHLSQLEELLKDSVLHIPLHPFSPAISGARIAYHILDGSIALREKRVEAAIQAFRRANEVDETLVYNEPRDWLLNSGQYLGNALLVAGLYDEARAVFEKDLERNNENAWSLFGLFQVLDRKRMDKESSEVWKRFKAATTLSDIRFTTAAY
jgi:tetratricopeptide (TPR) repeat protein